VQSAVIIGTLAAHRCRYIWYSEERSWCMVYPPRPSRHVTTQRSTCQFDTIHYNVFFGVDVLSSQLAKASAHVGWLI